MLRDVICLGVAGNFANHLSQAGEDADFRDIKTTEESEPKGIFPFYLPGSKSFLGRYPISLDNLELPQNDNAQVEPEIGILFDVEYNSDKSVKDIIAKKFTVFNDTTIRKEGAKKISQKKNWSSASKGIASEWIDIDSFDNGGVMDSFRLKSYIIRDETIYDYGVDAPLLGYSYFYKKLQKWLVDKINNQKDFGPLEDIAKAFRESNYPKKLFVTIGATAYTEFGQNNYIEPNDKIVVQSYCTKSGKTIKLEQIAI